MKRTILIITASVLMLISLLSLECDASSGNTGTHGAQFLKLGVGGRAIAMGDAFVGLANDGSAIYWNPAGLAGINRIELSFMHLFWLGDISYEYFAHVQPFGKWGVFGWSIAYLHMDKLEGRNHQGEPIPDFTSSDMAITFSHGHKITDNLLFGVSIKYINEKIEDQNAYAFAFDLGGLYETLLEGLFLGGTVQNWGEDITFVNEPCKLPMVFKAGASYGYTLAGNPMNFVMDIYFPSDNKTSLHLGTECIFKNVLAGRIGYKNGSDLGTASGLSFGLGFEATKTITYRIDYGFVPQGVLGNTHTISLLVCF